MEKSCKNCEFFKPFGVESTTRNWFRCTKHGERYFTLIPCDDHEFATESAEPTWQPKNPDDYEPGCRNEECCFFGKFYHCRCMLRPYDGYLEKSHIALCERVTCYDPKPKPKMQKFLVFKGEFSDELEKKLMDILNEKKYSLEIVEEEVDKYVD